MRLPNEQRRPERRCKSSSLRELDKRFRSTRRDEGTGCSKGFARAGAVRIEESTASRVSRAQETVRERAKGVAERKAPGMQPASASGGTGRIGACYPPGRPFTIRDVRVLPRSNSPTQAEARAPRPTSMPRPSKGGGDCGDTSPPRPKRARSTNRDRVTVDLVGKTRRSLRGGTAEDSPICRKGTSSRLRGRHAGSERHEREVAAPFRTTTGRHDGRQGRNFAVRSEGGRLTPCAPRARDFAKTLGVEERRAVKGSSARRWPRYANAARMNEARDADQLGSRTRRAAAAWSKRFAAIWEQSKKT